MSQIIKTKHFGEVEFLKTWVISGGKHIGRLVKGGYSHLGGQVIAKKKDLTDCIPAGKDLDDALAWWENKDKEKEDEVAPKRVLIQKDGSYVFEDGSPISDVADLIAAIPRGPALDAAVSWFSAKSKTQGMTDLNADIRREKTVEKHTIEARRKAGR